MTRVPVLMYHSITGRPNAGTRPLAVRPSDLAAQLTHLRDRGFTPLSVGDLVAALDGHDGSALPARPVVVTFDDGYADFHTEALPVLERLRFPATVFVTTGWLRDAGAHAAGRPLDTMLSWSQVAEAAACGVEIGGHSHSHPQLDQLADAEIRDELRRNRDLIEDRVGRPVTSMAYPYGYSSARVRRHVREAGYLAACAVGDAMAAGRHDVLAIPRLTVGAGMGIRRFRLAVEGTGVPLLYFRRRALTKGYAIVRRARYAVRQAAPR